MHVLRAPLMRSSMLMAQHGPLRLATCAASQDAFTFAAAPGLLVWRSFVEDPVALFPRAWKLADAVSELAAASPQSSVSPQHNLRNQREEYVSVVLPDAGRSLNCEHFKSYGEGHELTYFRGNRNLPSLVLPVVEWLEALPAVQREVFEGRSQRGRKTDRPLEWRLTLNRYQVRDIEARRAGFPWHRDIEANGASTMIVGLGTAGRIQFAENTEGELDGMKYDAGEEPEPCVDVTLAPGDLLVLTGKARWDMIHRVVGEDEAAAAAAGDAEGRARMEIVLGCW